MASGSSSRQALHQASALSWMAPTSCATGPKSRSSLRKIRARAQHQARMATPPPEEHGSAAPAGDPSLNLSRLFILRPVATSLLMVAILLIGIIAYRFLP